MRSVLIHGAGGFVARLLLPRLVLEGVRRLVLTDRRPLPDDRADRLSRAGIEVQVLELDRLCGDFEALDVDAAVCVAGATSVDAALTDPAPAMLNNVAIAVDLGEWLRRRAGKLSTRLVYLSSDEVLGASDQPLSASAPLRPTQPYAASKAASELLLHDLRDVYGLDVRTLRSCNLVGAGQKAPKLLPVAVASILGGHAVPIHGDGTQKREWMGAADLCDAIVKLLAPAVSPGVYHAASGVWLSVREVVDLVAHALGRRADTVEVPDRLVQDRCYAMDASSLRALGWQPRTDPGQAITEAAQALAAELP